LLRVGEVPTNCTVLSPVSYTTLLLLAGIG